LQPRIERVLRVHRAKGILSGRQAALTAVTSKLPSLRGLSDPQQSTVIDDDTYNCNKCDTNKCNNNNCNIVRDNNSNSNSNSNSNNNNNNNKTVIVFISLQPLPLQSWSGVYVQLLTQHARQDMSLGDNESVFKKLGDSPANLLINQGGYQLAWRLMMESSHSFSEHQIVSMVYKSGVNVIVIIS
jgi:hypothetical protein